MKTVYLLFILLIALTNCITKVSYYSTKYLPTNENYFYLDASYYKTSGYVYLYFQDYYYHLNYNSLQVCFTDTNPETSYSSCSFSSYSPSYRLTTSSSSQYLYEIKYQNKYYIVVRYSGSGSSLSYSSLSVETSSSDVHNLIGAVLSTIAIIGIVIGSVVVLSIIITILCCCCVCARAATPVTYVNPQPIVYTSPAAYPLTANNF